MSTRTIDPELAQFEAMYQAKLAERTGGGIVPDEIELELVDDLIRGALAGDVELEGRIAHVAPGSINPADPAFIAAEVAGTNRGASLPALILMGALALAFVGYVIATLLGLTSSPAGSDLPPQTATALALGTAQARSTATALAAGGSVTTASAGGTPVATAVAGGTPVAAPTLAGGFVSIGGQALPTVVPDNLEIAGRALLIYPAGIKDRNWEVNQGPTVANWLPGSILNLTFVLVLDSDPDAATWTAQIQPGSMAIVRMAGRARSFRLDTRRTIERTQTEYLNPHVAGLTVFVRAGALTPGDKRLLLHGQEVADGPGAGLSPALTPTASKEVKARP